MGKSTVQDAIDNAVAAYRGIESIGGRGAEIVEAVWDAFTAGMKSAVGRRIASCMGAEWCGEFKRDAFNRYLAFVELCVTGEKVAFLERTPAAELQAAMKRMGLAPISGGAPVATDRAPKPAKGRTATHWPAWTDEPIPYRLAESDAEYRAEVDRFAGIAGPARLIGRETD